jgi:hypothetical protein
MNAKTKQHNDDVIIIAVAICYTLFTLLFQLISELWHSYLNNYSLPKLLATNPSPMTKALNNTQPTLTSKTHPKVPSPAQEMSTRNKQGVLRCYWIPAGGNYSSEEQDELTGWYDVPDLEDIEEFTFDSCCPTPAGDDVEPDHPDSWLSILGLI